MEFDGCDEAEDLGEGTYNIKGNWKYCEADPTDFEVGAGWNLIEEF
jgi:hypothetical protein